MPIILNRDQPVRTVESYSVRLCVHQGPPGIRGTRGEKVNTTSPFLIFTCHYMS